MPWFQILVVALAAIAIFFWWANRQTAKAHARFQAKDVEAALAELVSPDARNLDTWDLFLAWPIDDRYLESVRQRCLSIAQECQATHAREDISSEGRTRIEALLWELRNRP